MLSPHCSMLCKPLRPQLSMFLSADPARAAGTANGCREQPMPTFIDPRMKPSRLNPDSWLLRNAEKMYAGSKARGHRRYADKVCSMLYLMILSRGAMTERHLTLFAKLGAMIMQGSSVRAHDGGPQPCRLAVPSLHDRPSKWHPASKPALMSATTNTTCDHTGALNTAQPAWSPAAGA